MRYEKPPLSISELVTLLESRGLHISDRERAEHYLSNISYYRLSAYTFPFKNLETDTFSENTSFDDVLNLYLFDRNLRLLIFDVIERLEIAFRTQLIYQPAIQGGAFWFEDVNNYFNRLDAQKHLQKLDEEVRRSNEVFIKHCRMKYDSSPRPPAWMTFEVLSLGLLSKICRNLGSYKIRTEIAAHFGLTQNHFFESWLQCMVYVRNICAHHSRLWNRVLTIKPRIMQRSRSMWIDTSEIRNDKLYYFLCCLRFMLKEVDPGSKFAGRLKTLLAENTSVPISAMGFPDNWIDQEFWREI